MTTQTRHLATIAQTLSQNLDTAMQAGETARRDMETQSLANDRIARSSQTLRDGGERIGNALARIAETGIQLRTAQARLLFENGRLKRSTKGMRESADRLGKAQEILYQRAREAKEIAEFADRTAVLIAAIETSVARGESANELIAQGLLLLGLQQKSA